MTNDVWRITRKVGTTQVCLASNKVDGYVHFCYSSGDKLMDFNLAEARMLHSALGAMLPEMKDMTDTAPVKAVVARDGTTAPAENSKKAAAASKEAVVHAGSRWTDEEDVKLIASLRAGKSITELSLIHKRSPSAIMSRLHKNDLIEITVK